MRWTDRVPGDPSTPKGWYDVVSGDVVIIEGNGEPGTADGRGSEASFGRLNAITLGPDGAFYVNHGDAGGVTPVSIRRIVHTP